MPTIEQQRAFNPENVKIAIVARTNDTAHVLDIFLHNQSGCPIALVGFTCDWADDVNPKRLNEKESMSNAEARKLHQKEKEFYKLYDPDSKEFSVDQCEQRTITIERKSVWGLLPSRIRMTFGIHSGLDVRANADDLIHFKRELLVLQPANIPEFQSGLLIDGKLACFGDELPQRLDMLEGASRSLIKAGKAGPVAGIGLGGGR